MKVPFADLKQQYQAIKGPIDEAIKAVVENTAFVRGPFVKAFEEEYAKEYGVKHCVSCANGTDAIYISMKALGIGPGDEVITVANSWISTSETISQTGAKPVFVDIDPDYYTINPDLIEAKITDRTRAIIPVHLFGQPADMDAIMAICKKHNLFLIEDCAQAHFAEYGPEGSRKLVGTMGDTGTFSFYPGKNLGAYGDAGAIVTNDKALADKLTMYANHGSLKKHEHEIEGINSRLDGLQAAVLSVKLKHIRDWSAARAANAAIYDELLADVDGIDIPKVRPNATHVYHLYVIRSDRRDELQKYLGEQGIGCGVHYPTALPLLKAYEYLGGTAEDFPVAASYQSKILSLPMFPELTREQIEYVCSHIKKFVSGQ